MYLYKNGEKIKVTKQAMNTNDDGGDGDGDGEEAGRNYLVFMTIFAALCIIGGGIYWKFFMKNEPNSRTY